MALQASLQTHRRPSLKPLASPQGWNLPTLSGFLVCPPALTLPPIQPPLPSSLPSFSLLSLTGLSCFLFPPLPLTTQLWFEHNHPPIPVLQWEQQSPSMDLGACPSHSPFQSLPLLPSGKPPLPELLPWSPSSSYFFLASGGTPNLSRNTAALTPRKQDFYDREGPCSYGYSQLSTLSGFTCCCRQKTYKKYNLLHVCVCVSSYA